MPSSDAMTYTCVKCLKDIVDHVYLVQRRKVRPLREVLPSGPDGKPIIKHNPSDAIETFHAGIQVGPEEDPYCPLCYAKLPTIQELINDFKSNLNKTS